MYNLIVNLVMLVLPIAVRSINQVEVEDKILAIHNRVKPKNYIFQPFKRIGNEN